ncbi:MAG: CDP-diacylglycerol--serine O-phosphatidyltransferase [Smithella sp.]|jgi:CDP-diacylglycerol--serine O-phosphatidyltransferase|nr:CDP-diacylglycerol--serine O-phosphatidyltransferase [Smithella sp.]
MNDESPSHKEHRLQKIKFKKGIYVLPNLLTTASLFMGFYSIVASIQEKFFWAAVAIFASLVFDGLDGRVARITNSTSKFGAEYDSLSDLVAFGVAPALLAYVWAMSFYGKLGWMAGFLFVACGALRLARYNIQIGIIDSKVFNGLPIPAAASVIAATVIFFHDIGVEGTFHNPGVVIMVSALSLLMVSNIKYYSGKDMKLFSRMPFRAFLVVVGVILIVVYKPEVAIFIFFVTYGLSGPVWWIVKTIKKLNGKGLGANPT